MTGSQQEMEGFILAPDAAATLEPLRDQWFDWPLDDGPSSLRRIIRADSANEIVEHARRLKAAGLTPYLVIGNAASPWLGRLLDHEEDAGVWILDLEAMPEETVFMLTTPPEAVYAHFADLLGEEAMPTDAPASRVAPHVLSALKKPLREWLRNHAPEIPSAEFEARWQKLHDRLSHSAFSEVVHLRITPSAPDQADETPELRLAAADDTPGPLDIIGLILHEGQIDETIWYEIEIVGQRRVKLIFASDDPKDIGRRLRITWVTSGPEAPDSIAVTLEDTGQSSPRCRAAISMPVPSCPGDVPELIITPEDGVG